MSVCFDEKYRHIRTYERDQMEKDGAFRSKRGYESSVRQQFVMQQAFNVDMLQIWNIALLQVI